MLLLFLSMQLGCHLFQFVYTPLLCHIFYIYFSSVFSTLASVPSLSSSCSIVPSDLGFKHSRSEYATISFLKLSIAVYSGTLRMLVAPALLVYASSIL